MSGGSQPDTVTQTQQTDLPDWLKPQAQTFLGRAEALSNMPYQSYDGELVAGMTPEHELALSGLTNRGIYGSPDQNLGSMNLQNTLAGNYMSPDANPWLSQMVDYSNQDITDAYSKGIAAQTDRELSMSNNLNSSAGREIIQDNQQTLADALARNTTGIYGQNYMNERENQMQGVGMAPNYAMQDYLDLHSLLGVGDARQGYNQAVLDADYGQFLEQRAYPYDQLNVLGNALGAVMGTGSQITSQTPVNQPNPLMNLAGLGMMGYGMFG